MPDITMCEGFNCKVKEKCYRYTAYPNVSWQSYFAVNPNPDNEKQCTFFILDNRTEEYKQKQKDYYEESVRRRNEWLASMSANSNSAVL